MHIQYKIFWKIIFHLTGKREASSQLDYLLLSFSWFTSDVAQLKVEW